MQEIPLCRFVNKRIDLEPKFNIFEYSSVIGKVFRQIRTNYYYKKNSKLKSLFTFPEISFC